MLVLGAGVGLCMQVLTIIVQNNADYRDLGVATSGVTFFRTMGSAFGAAIFGTIYANQLSGNLKAALATVPGVNPAALSSPAALHALPSAQSAPIIDAYSSTVQTLFFSAVPTAVLALLGLFLRRTPLREATRAGASDVGSGFAIPGSRQSSDQLELAIAKVLQREGAAAAPNILAAAHTRLDISDAWCTHQVDLHTYLTGRATLSNIAAQLHIPTEVLWPAFARAVSAGYLRSNGDELWLTTSGATEIHKITEQWRTWLSSRLTGWLDGTTPEETELTSALDHLARRMMLDETPNQRQPALTAPSQ
jgi:hypothetical protein